MCQKQQGDTFPDISFRISFIYTVGALYCLQSKLGRPWGLKVKFSFSSLFFNHIKL